MSDFMQTLSFFKTNPSQTARTVIYLTVLYDLSLQIVIGLVHFAFKYNSVQEILQFAVSIYCENLSELKFKFLFKMSFIVCSIWNIRTVVIFNQLTENIVTYYEKVFSFQFHLAIKHSFVANITLSGQKVILVVISDTNVFFRNQLHCERTPNGLTYRQIDYPLQVSNYPHVLRGQPML